MTAPVLLPVGFGLGIWTPAGEPEYCIRLAGEAVAVSPAEYDLWWQSRFHPTAGALLDQARTDGVPSPGAAVEGLFAAGLLAEPDPAFAAAHRLVTTGLGGGYDEQSADGLLAIADAAGRPLVRVDPATYLCWALSDGTVSLADATVATGLDPAALWPALAGLLEVGAGYLDRMVP
ncbi:hypothetical protein ACQP00_20015 [Dactylosporangium sp. CS-047395]|uniref:hypothetical protein n=1 Tax=Dactylosporangium sp. CS-047395 TaxID=3239936 RepID=UPI003D93AA9F